MAATGADTDGGAESAPVIGIARGEVVGRYVVLGEVGRGGMGVVFAAYDPELDRKVAIKVLRRLDGRDRAHAQARLQREAQAMARLTHPNVVAVHDVGTIGDQIYVAMEFIEGRTLRQWTVERERTWRDVLAVLHPVAGALAAAHAAGLVHRDIKPDNVMIGASNGVREVEGRVWVMDFGLARGIGSEPTDADPGAALPPDDATASSSRARLDDMLTRVGATLGTPAYMAPEQVAGRAVDGRSDQFSYCVMAWEALYRQRPFEGDTLAELTYNVLEQRLRPPPRGREVPGRIRRALERGLRVEPAERWPSMDALLEELSSAATSRRTQLVVAGLGIVAVGLGAGVYWRAQPPLCAGAEAAIAGVWSDAHRERAATSIHASGAAYADDVWARVAPRLDAWAEAWVDARTDACEATRRRGEQSEAVMDLRMACLARAELAFAAATRVLAEATPEVLERAHDIVGGLPRLSRCADVEALRAEVEPPPPELEPAVAAIREDLAEAAARRMAGAYGAALAAATRAKAALDGLRYEPIATEVWLELGYVHEELGRYAEAEQDLQQVRRIGAAWRQWDAVRDATVQLVSVLGGRQGRYAEALVLEPLADGLVGDDSESSALLRSHLASVAFERGDYAAAEAYLQDALARFEDPITIAQQRDVLGGILLAQGRYAEAEAEHRAALAGLRQDLGPEHPSVARALSNLAIVLQTRGELGSAESQHREALALMIATRGEQHPEVAIGHNNLALVLRMQRKLAEAETEQRTAIAIGEATLGPDHPNVAAFHEGLGMVLQDAGRPGDALPEQRLALAKLEALHGPDHPDVARARNNLARALFALGDHPESERLQRQVLAVWQATLPPDHPSLAISHGNLAKVLHVQGKLAAAEVELRAVLELRERTATGDDDPTLADAMGAVGRIVLEQGRAAEAIPLLERARAMEARTGVAPELRARTLLALARAKWSTPGARDEARALADEAAAAYGTAGTAGAAGLEELMAWRREHP
jgi:tetratricopeptide (TPR) repeat protein